MYERVLWKMRALVRSGQYVVSFHALEELEKDGLTALDVEHVILNGSILARQRDRWTGEWKYVVRGHVSELYAAAVVAKLASTGNLVIITVFLL